MIDDWHAIWHDTHYTRTTQTHAHTHPYITCTWKHHTSPIHHITITLHVKHGSHHKHRVTDQHRDSKHQQSINNESISQHQQQHLTTINDTSITLAATNQSHPNIVMFINIMLTFIAVSTHSHWASSRIKFVYTVQGWIASWMATTRYIFIDDSFWNFEFLISGYIIVAYVWCVCMMPFCFLHMYAFGTIVSMSVYVLSLLLWMCRFTCDALSPCQVCVIDVCFLCWDFISCMCMTNYI